MKKTLIFLLALFCVILISAYIFAPRKIDFNETIRIGTTQTSASRFLTDGSIWNKYWPEKRTNKKVNPSTNYTYKNYHYNVNLQTIWGDSITIKNRFTKVNSTLQIIPFGNDSVAFQWSGQSAPTSDALSRFENYSQEKKIKNDIRELLEGMKVFLENEKNLYGIDIHQAKVRDTLLTATRYSSDAYPTTQEIYNLIRSLKDYILKKGAKETNYPMLHVTKDSSRFSTMVAIPVNKLIPTDNNFLFKRMVPGKILVTQVTGGVSSTENALKQLETYIMDKHLKSPAIPFESLVTNRLNEPDTLKWVTKIYYPIY
jgi:hypothetical protein